MVDRRAWSRRNGELMMDHRQGSHAAGVPD